MRRCSSLRTAVRGVLSPCLARPSGHARVHPTAVCRFNYLAGFVGQTLAGVIAVRDTTHVHHLFVAPEFQRKGLAGKLWARAKADAVSSGNKDRSREAAI